ncbi:MAG: hypothetical protein ACOYLV_05695 [Rubrivivax sp.]
MNETPDPAPADDSCATPQVVEGPSFPLALRVLATVMVALVALTMGQWALQGSWRGFGAGGLFFMGAVLLVVACGYVGILRSRTSFDGRHIRQSWLWPKEVAVEQITQVKLIHLPGLSWLICPRLVVRTGGLNVTTFQCGDRSVLAAWRLFVYGGP